MLNQVVTLLTQKGYRLFGENKGIFFRETEQVVYIVALSVFHEGMKPEDYEAMRRRIEFFTVSRYQKNVSMLHLIVTEKDVFDEVLTHLVDRLDNVWIFSEESGRIYLFENQPGEFDELYDYLENGIKISEMTSSRSIPFAWKPVNMAIVALNILYFVVIILLNGGYFAVYNTDTMLKMGALSYDTFINGAWYSIVVSLFMHYGLSHLFNNMVLLTYAGCELEARIGSVPYLILYFFTGICGNIASLWYYNYIGENSVSVGASGAIFGVIGALVVVLVLDHSKKQYLTPKRLLFMAGMTIYCGLTTIGVDNAAHIGGFLSGIIGGLLLSKIAQYGKLD